MIRATMKRKSNKCLNNKWKKYCSDIIKREKTLREFRDNGGESQTWHKKCDTKRSEKSNTKAFFISASFVYFVLATTPLLITIIRRDNVPVVFQPEKILLLAKFCPRYRLPEIIPVKHFSAANPPPHQLSTYASPQNSKHFSNKCSCLFSIVTQLAYMAAGEKVVSTY